MNLSKEQLQRQLDLLLKRRRIFLICSICLFSLGAAFVVAWLVFFITKGVDDDLAFAFSISSDLCISAAIVLLILRSSLYSYKINIIKAILNGTVQASVVDDMGSQRTVYTTNVNPFPSEKEAQPQAIKTREQELVDQYEDLYKKGYISQEDFETKKKEILG